MKKVVEEISLMFALASMVMLAVGIQSVECASPPEIEWSKAYGGLGRDIAASVVQTSDGGYAIAGATTSSGETRANHWLVKTDSSGNLLWNRTYGGAESNEAWDMIQTSDGGYALAGHTDSFSSDRDFWLVKTDLSGNMLWNRTYGGTSVDQARSVVETNDGGYALAGCTFSYGAGYDDFWLVKTDSTGTMQWSQTYGGADWDGADSVVQTSDGGYAIAGDTNSFGCGSYDFWLIRTDALGNALWNETCGGLDIDFALSMIQTRDRGYAITGPTLSFGSGDYDFWLVKFESEPAPPSITATVYVDPDTLNLKSNGEWISCYIELPEDCSLGDIAGSSILLNDSIGVDPEAPMQVGDFDSDGVPDLMVKFDRASALAVFGTVDYGEDTGKSVTVTVVITGDVAGMPFEGADAIRVLLKG